VPGADKDVEDPAVTSETQSGQRIAVVLFNLGGPDKPESVQPFLFNLFYDPAIIRLIKPLRWMIAKLISSRRAPIAKENYAYMGGGSPILPLTMAQAKMLEVVLGEQVGEAKVFIAMRYWHPMSRQTAAQVKAYKPDRIVLLPLYPHFSTTTTGSSLKDWDKAARAARIDPAREVTVCCYPRNAGFLAGHAETITQALQETRDTGKVRVLFSAHGLPESIIKAGDPYQSQIELTVQSLVGRIREKIGGADFDWRICYQSRVGPMKWLQPSTDAEIGRAGSEKTGLIVVPIAFVSDHVETLVELDIEYKKLAEEAGVPFYKRVAALGTNEAFIRGLGEIVQGALARADGSGQSLGPDEGSRICASGFSGCPCKTTTV